MSIIGWVILGVVAGLIATAMNKGTGGGWLVDMMLGVLGAMLGGYAFQLVWPSPLATFNVWSVVVAGLGAIAVLSVYHLFASKGPTYA